LAKHQLITARYDSKEVNQKQNRGVVHLRHFEFNETFCFRLHGMFGTYKFLYGIQNDFRRDKSKDGNLNFTNLKGFNYSKG